MSGLPGESGVSRVRTATLWLTLGLWGFSAVSFAGSLIVGGAWSLSTSLIVWLGLATLTGLGFSLLLYGSVQALRTRPAGLRWPVLIGAVIIVTMVQALIDGLLNSAVRALFGEPSGLWFNTANFGVNCLIYLGIFGFYTAALELIATMERAAVQARQAAEARELAREAQVQMLRLQLNPHFLFNTLNSISSLVVSRRPQMAEMMISRLAQFMRASLQPTEDALVPLGHELSAMEAYLDIESVRFSDALDIEIDCPSELDDILVPNLILQPLVENAIKYALTPSDGASRMRVTVRENGPLLVISVSDEGAARSSEVGSGAGIGLENVRRRLEVIYGGAARLEASGDGADGFNAQISLPSILKP